MQAPASSPPAAPRSACAAAPTPTHPPGSRSWVTWSSSPSSSIAPIDPRRTATDRCTVSVQHLRSPGRWPVALAAGAVPPPPLGPPSCPMCLGPTWRPGRRCWPCVVADRALGATCPPLVTVAAYRAGSPLHAALRGYKDGDHAPARARWADALAALLTGVAVTHRPCLTALIGPVDAVCVVPGRHHRAGGRTETTLGGDHGARTSGTLGSTEPSGCDASGYGVPRGMPPGAHPHRGSPRGIDPSNAEPLHAVLDRVPAWAALRRVRLEPGPGTVDHLRPAPDAFSCDERLDGCRVLVVDDTWTTGAQARSAAAAVTGAGGHVAGIVAVGRFVAPHASVGTAAWWRWATACALARASVGVVDARWPLPDDGGRRSAHGSLHGVSGDAAPGHLVAANAALHWDRHQGRRSDPPCLDPRCPVQLPGRRRPVPTGPEDAVRPNAAQARSRRAAPGRDRRP
jgi:hypothetical protein